MIVLNRMKWKKTESVKSLKQIETEPLTPKHQPLNHGLCLELFLKSMAKHHLVNGEGLLSPDGLKYLFVADAVGLIADPEYVVTVGFVNYNDGTKSLTELMGERVLVCSNEMYTHQVADLKKRHSGNTPIDGDAAEKFDLLAQMLKRTALERAQEIKGLRQSMFDDPQVGAVVLELHRTKLISRTNIHKMVLEWDRPRHEEFKPRTAWSFQNCCSEVLKCVEPVRRLWLMKIIASQIKRLLPGKE